MSTVELTPMLRAEWGRLLRDRVVLSALSCLVVGCAALTAAAVRAAAGADHAGSGPVSIQTTKPLDAGSTSADLASFVAASLALTLPILAVVLGSQLGARDLGNGALLTLATTVRRLRPVIVVRFVLMLAVSMAAGLAALVAATAAADASLPPRFAGLSAWPILSAMALGAVVQTVTLGAVAFGLAVLLRRATVVLIFLLLWILAAEPVLRGLAPDAGGWLPVRATSTLTSSGLEAATHCLPTIGSAFVLAGLAMAMTTRDRSYR